MPQCSWDDGCTRPAEGTISKVADPLEHWPDNLVGDFCGWHGKIIVERVPRLDSTVVLSWIPFSPITSIEP